MADEGLRIGDLAAATATKTETIRYYERIGLLPTPERTSGNYRAYGPRHLDRLSFIRHARELGFSIEAIRDLSRLADQPEQPCDAADRIARTHLHEVERRLARLAALKAELERMLTRCEGGRIAECRVIEVLADHSHRRCLSPEHGERAGPDDAMPRIRPGRAGPSRT
jgi:DNA-binding transcriptional MerR regulator